jgi:hypothetical protein
MKKDIHQDFLTLVFIGNKLDPEIITEWLGIEPCSCARKGDPAHSKSNTKVKKGYWTIGTKPNMEISKQLTCFTNKLMKKKRSLSKIINMETVEEAFLDLVIYPASNYGVHGLHLKANDLKFWSSIGVDMVCSFCNPYVWGNLSGRGKIKRSKK